MPAETDVCHGNRQKLVTLPMVPRFPHVCKNCFDPIHYLIQCPGLPNILQTITHKLPVKHSLPEGEKAK